MKCERHNNQAYARRPSRRHTYFELGSRVLAYALAIPSSPPRVSAHDPTQLNQIPSG
ncbi:hypothetical protein B0H19DRAFT_1121129 [Mycena capillaripes]|nr:hypothetical protein B0H19DRAFT_1121129 [Mycena capillaripes]